MGLTVALAQIAPRARAVEDNMNRAESWIRRAGGVGAHLVVLPELVDTGYEMDAVRETASPWEVGPAQRVACLARELGLHVAIGLAEKVEGAIYNSVGVFSPEGRILGRYRKAHLFSDEKVNEATAITPGDRTVVLPLLDTRVGILICYDLRFPEHARKLTLDGARVLLVPSAFPSPRQRHWQTLLAARAIENQVFVLGANRVGREGDLRFCGNSSILDPYGATLASADERAETLVTCTLDVEEAEVARRRMPVWRDRRPELYR